MTLPATTPPAVRCTGLPIDDVIPMASTIPAAYMGETPAGMVTADWDAEGGELQIRRIAP